MIHDLSFATKSGVYLIARTALPVLSDSSLEEAVIL